MNRPGELDAFLRTVRILVLDVDGVLTDGTLIYGPEGEAYKTFHVRDGLGIKLLLREGIEVAVISARRSTALETRLGELGIVRAYLGHTDKGTALESLLADVGCDPTEVAYVGDDLVDLQLFGRVGLAIAVRNAHPRVRDLAGWVTEADGGRGAVREVVDAILEARGRLDDIVDAYQKGGL